jgi:hypothetical protein
MPATEELIVEATSLAKSYGPLKAIDRGDRFAMAT